MGGKIHTHMYMKVCACEHVYLVLGVRVKKRGPFVAPMPIHPGGRWEEKMLVGIPR